MFWATAITQRRNLAAAAEDLGKSLLEALGGRPVDFAAVFVSPHFLDSFEDLPELMQECLSPGVLVGCLASGVIGGGVEVEQQPAMVLTAAHLPGVSVHPFHLEPGDLPGPDDPPSAWVETLGVDPLPTPHFVLLADPYSLDPTDLLRGLDFAYPESAKVGGLASGATRPGVPSLLLGQDVHASGGIGVAFQGNLRLETVVAQGCRPVGNQMTVTRSDANLLLEVDGRNPVEALVSIYTTLPHREQALMQSSLLIGVASTELREDLGPGDFLIRPLIGVDQDRGTLAVGGGIRAGQTVQFHVRDAETATEDLEIMLSRYREGVERRWPAGALLFSCQGRGEQLFGVANHDSDAFRRALGQVPLGGFFCAGEIGPVGDSTYVHGFTSSFGIFRPLAE